MIRGLTALLCLAFLISEFVYAGVLIAGYWLGRERSILGLLEFAGYSVLTLMAAGMVAFVAWVVYNYLPHMEERRQAYN